jgi:anti-sigma B factor antagonist
MANNPPGLLVALVDHAAIVKINGRANFTSSVAFKRLISELRQRGCLSFVLDLSLCVTMDSTFLGVLAGAALMLAEADKTPQNGSLSNELAATPRLHLLNPNQRVADLLDNLGVSDLFQTVHCAIEPEAEQYRAAGEDIEPSREEVSRTCLEAHLLLMDLNPQNIPKFKEVTQFLAEDLKRLNAEAASDSASPGPSPEACMAHRGNASQG